MPQNNKPGRRLLRQLYGSWYRVRHNISIFARWCLFAVIIGVVVGAVGAADNIRVQLARENRVLRTEARGFAENAVVFQHVFRPVAAVRAQIQAGKTSLAHAAEARGEAVDAALQRIGGQIFQFSMFDGVKHSFPQRCGHRESLPQVSARNEGGADQALF